MVKETAISVLACLCALTTSVSMAETVGVTDEVIKIGNTSPYSGPASAYGTIGKAQQACFDKINDSGGINGRRIEFISLDDAYSPPKTVEQVRKLVEKERVAFLYQNLGTPTNSAIQRYVNRREVRGGLPDRPARKVGDHLAPACGLGLRRSRDAVVQPVGLPAQNETAPGPARRELRLGRALEILAAQGFGPGDRAADPLKPGTRRDQPVDQPVLAHARGADNRDQPPGHAAASGANSETSISRVQT